jgi:uncharacterized protein (TIGR00297 family)
MTPPNEQVHAPNELLRKSIHIAVGFGALALHWLTWPLALLLAGAATLSNWLLLHRLVGRGVARHARGYDAGIVLYPLMVGVLIAIFRHALWIPAIAWVVLGFGDGVASLAGRHIGLAPLPWNRQKSWGGMIAFFIAGSIGALAIAALFGRADYGLVLLAVAVAAIGESLALGIDDNIVVPSCVAVVLAIGATAAVGAAPFVMPSWPAWLIVNTLLAAIGLALRSVDLSGAIAGWILGAILIVCGGWPMYVALLLFFIIGTACTKLGYSRKARLGLAQERGGRRGISHAVANVGVAALCAITLSLKVDSGAPVQLWTIALMGLAALATAAADTTASELGQLFGRTPFLPLTLRRVPVGTEGAISVEGTLAGLAAGALVAAAGWLSYVTMIYASGLAPRFLPNMTFIVRPILAVTFAAVAGSYVESLIGSWNRKQAVPITNGALNFLNTVAGAFIVYAISWLVPLFGVLDR